MDWIWPSTPQLSQNSNIQPAGLFSLMPVKHIYPHIILSPRTHARTNIHTLVCIHTCTQLFVLKGPVKFSWHVKTSVFCGLYTPNCFDLSLFNFLNRPKYFYFFYFFLIFHCSLSWKPNLLLWKKIHIYIYNLFFVFHRRWVIQVLSNMMATFIIFTVSSSILVLVCVHSNIFCFALFLQNSRERHITALACGHYQNERRIKRWDQKSKQSCFSQVLLESGKSKYTSGKQS